MLSSTVIRKLSIASTGAALIGISIATAGVEKAKAGTITFDNQATSCPSKTYISAACFVEDGLSVEAFWAISTGSANGNIFGGHWHRDNGAENQHYNGSTDLQGFLVKKTDGSAFSLSSLDYYIDDSTSINGYNPSDVKVLISTAFNPKQSVASQFTAFSVGTTLSNTLRTLAITGFENVTQVFISSSASVAFDNVRTDVAKSKSVPEPTSALGLLALGTLGAGSMLKRKKATVKA